VGGKPIASAQFLINPDSSARALWQFLPAESSSGEAGETWRRNVWAEFFLQSISFHANRLLCHAVNLRHGTEALFSRKERCVSNFNPLFIY
jgi:hypothetical protein